MSPFGSDDGLERCRSSATRRFSAFRMSLSSVAALRATMPTTGAGLSGVICEPTAATGIYSDATSAASRSRERAASLIGGACSARHHQLIVDAFDAVSMRRQVLSPSGSLARGDL